MSRAILLSLFAATVVVAGVPVTFSAGSPAKADEVNKNFNYLDSAVGKKASQASLDAVAEALKNKADASALSAKADQSKLDDLAKTVGAKADTSKVRDLSNVLATKANQVYIDTALKRRADTTWVKERISTAQSASGALLKTNNLSDLGDKSAARTNLGLGKLAIMDSLKPSDLGAISTAGGSLTGTISGTSANFSGAVTAGVGTNSAQIAAYAGGAAAWFGHGGLNSSTLATTAGYVSWFDGGALVAVPTGRTWFASVGGNKILDITGSGATVKGTVVVTTGIASGGTSTLLGSGLLINRNLAYIQTADSTQKLIMQTDETRFMDQTNKLVLASIKNVGSKGNLVVSGTITAQTSSSSVPDYVFEPDYKLMPLAEVEAFTKTNKHLPEVPSAAEIEKSGLDLAKMNLILLKKVEELTLHTIELEKRLKAVEAKD